MFKMFWICDCCNKRLRADDVSWKFKLTKQTGIKVGDIVEYDRDLCVKCANKINNYFYSIMGDIEED